ncbi:methyltransferase domain-containing protein [Anaplasmataceae bacterium AB001_6]|nr:methyltransferase domain-containing protein [Anaplasmataceae bacterium AB001_6]
MNSNLMDVTHFRKVFSEYAFSEDNMLLLKYFYPIMCSRSKIANPVIMQLGCFKHFTNEYIEKLGYKEVINVDFAKGMMTDVIGEKSLLQHTLQLNKGFENRFDLVLSFIIIEMFPNIQRTIIEIYSTLKIGGQFIAAVFGEDNLKELKTIVKQENIASENDHKNLSNIYIGSILQMSMFQKIVLQNEYLVIKYKRFSDLFRDLQALGYSVYIPLAKKIKKSTYKSIKQKYKELFYDKVNGYTVTIHLILISCEKR